MRSRLPDTGSTAALIALILIGAVMAWIAYKEEHRGETAKLSTQAQPTTPISKPNSKRLKPPLMGAHYFGRQWPKNFINGFRREHVAQDFARLRADGFNAVVLLVSWGDFQPVFEPCCHYDERAFERLDFLIERAREAKLDVVLRVGYGWTFHPAAGHGQLRTHRLLNEQRVRDSFLAFIARIGEMARKQPTVRLSLLSWEDLWLHEISPGATADFRQFLGTLKPDDSRRQMPSDDDGIPTSTGVNAPLFHAYWDWLLMQKLFLPAAERLRPLGFEARIDREPLPQVDAEGRTTYSWIGHETTYRPPGADVVSLYWAPFWGARNEGEHLDARQAQRLLGALLDEVRRHSGGLPLFVDQLNVIDNTPGHEQNAVLHPDALPAFMDAVFCTLRSAGAFGYAYWTTQDYAESPLYNPAFAYALEGWRLTTGDGTPAARRLVHRDTGDFDLRIARGDRLQQIIPAQRGRLPDRSDKFAGQVCITARTNEPAVLDVAAGDAPVRLHFTGNGEHTACIALSPRPVGKRLTLEIRGVRGTPALSSVMLFDHIQEGGVRRFDSHDGPLLPSLRTLNRRFADPDSPNCGKPDAKG